MGGKQVGPLNLRAAPFPREVSFEFRFAPQGPVLEAFHLSNAEVEGIQGPLGSAKTNGVLAKLFKLITEVRPQRDGTRRGLTIVTRNTYPDLIGTTIRDWRGVFTDELGRFKQDHPPVHELRFHLEDGTYVEHDVVFLALDREDHVKKLRGYQATFGWMNEAKEQPYAVLSMLRGRIGRTQRPEDAPPEDYRVLMDYNAPDDDHWLAALMDQAARGELPKGEARYKPGTFAFYVQPGGVIRQGERWVVNPNAENLQNLAAGYYERQLYGNKEDWIRVNLANLRGFAVDGKPVHPEFNSTIHLATAPLLPTANLPIIVGLDFGLTPAAAFLQRQVSGQWLALDEVVAIDLDAVGFLPLLQAKLADLALLAPGLRFEFIGDPSGDNRAQTDSESVMGILRAGGIPVRAAISNDTTLRRAALTRPLTRLVNGKPGFLVSPKCRVLAKGLAGGFCYKRLQVAGTDRFKDAPDKNEYSHVVEACEYGLLGGGENAKVGQTLGVQGAGVVVVKQTWSPFGPKR